MRKAAIIGCDIIGRGWAARFLLNGWDVVVHDPNPASIEKLHAVLTNARRRLPGLYGRPLPTEGQLSFAASPAAAATGADWVQLADLRGSTLKDTLEDIASLASSGAIIARSDEWGGDAPEASAIVARARDPVYLLPLVELAGLPDACMRAASTLRDIGMWPALNAGGAATADRLIAAIAEEAASLMANGASAQDIDEVLCMGPGLLLARSGLADIIESARSGSEKSAEPLAAPLPSGSEHARDDALVDIIRGLRRTLQGAGAVIAAHEATLALPDHGALPVTLCRQVPETWTDYNGHMSSHHYLETGSLAGDRFMELIGVDTTYIASGRSYFSVEDHVRYRAEIRAGDRITVTTQVLGGDGKRVHLFHFIHRGDGTLAATMETLLIHTDLTLRRACPPDPAVETSFARWVAAHAHLDRPKDAGRAVSRQTG